MVTGSLGPNVSGNATWSIATPGFTAKPMTGFTKVKIPITEVELQVGDLCIWNGKQTEYSVLNRRVIYQVVGKQASSEESWNRFVYQYRIAFDIENPVGSTSGLITYNGSREMKKLGLLDVATIRLHYDAFIKDWAIAQGQPSPDEVR